MGDKDKIILESKFSRFLPSESEERIQISKIINHIEERIGEKIVRSKKIKEGSNINYQLIGQNNGEFLLKLPIRKDNPSCDHLCLCFALLEQIGYENKLMFYDNSENIAPFGYMVFLWDKGKTIDEIDSEPMEKYNQEKYMMDDKYNRWIKDISSHLSVVHGLTQDYFGDLQGKFKFNSIHQYYNNIDKIINESFKNEVLSDFDINKFSYRDILCSNYLKNIFEKIRVLSMKIKNNKVPVLVHGDVSPANILYSNNSIRLIDWEEAKFHWWVADLARTSYYIESDDLINIFIDNYRPQDSNINEIKNGIAIEHTVQDIRKIIKCFTKEIDEIKLRNNVNKLKERINKRLKCI